MDIFGWFVVSKSIFEFEKNEISPYELFFTTICIINKLLFRYRCLNPCL